MKYDVHRIEQVRVKIADVEADSPAQALALTAVANLSAVLDREFDVALASVGPDAYAQSVSHHQAAPVSAMVEPAGSHGEEGEHHFLYDGDSEMFKADVSSIDPIREIGAASGSKTSSGVNSKAYIGELATTTAAGSTLTTHVLIVATDAAGAFRRLSDAAAGFYGEEDESVGNDAEGFTHDGWATKVTPGRNISELPPAAYHLLKGRFLTYTQDGAPEPLSVQGAPDMGSLVPVVPQIDGVLRNALGALSALAVQVGQMRGMFDDEDGAIEDAVDAGEDAEAAIRSLSSNLVSAINNMQTEPAGHSAGVPGPERQRG